MKATGERAKRCRWQIQRGERVAAVDDVKRITFAQTESGTATG